METNESIETAQTRREWAWAILHRLIDDKRQAEKRIVENFHTDPLIQAAVARLREENERRGTSRIPIQR